jgi:spore coat protein H
MFRCLALIAFALVCSVPLAPAAPASGVGDDLFTNQLIRHIKVEVPETSIALLRKYAFQQGVQRSERPEVTCTVREGGNVWTNVALHLKGSASFRSVDDAPSFTLFFSKHVPQQRFHGLEKISLNNSPQDPTRLSEKIARELYTRGGVPAPRAGYITAELNGRKLGLFVMLEGWNRQFMERHFPDARGPLYEGPFLTDIDRPLDVAYGKTNGHKLTISRLLGAAREPDPAKRQARLESVLDMDRFTRLVALDMLVWNGDGYAMHANNYRIFHDRKQGRFVFLPHGMDQTFTIPDAPALAGGDAIVSWAVLSLPEGRRRVLNRIREFRSAFFTPEAIGKRAAELSAQVGAALAREAGLTNGSAPAAYTAAVAGWLTLMTNRLASIDQQLVSITNLSPLKVRQPLVLTGWTNRLMAGAPVFLQPTAPASLVVKTSLSSTGAWVAPIWLEHGRYLLQGRVRAVPVVAPGLTNQVRAGLRVRSERKRPAGLDWGWDTRRRADYRPGGETGNMVYQPLPATAGTNWTELSCEIDLRQPVADLDIICEASGTGEAWFDKESLKLTRITDPGR